MTSSQQYYGPMCKHCRLNRESHVNDKCLWTPASFEGLTCTRCGRETLHYKFPFEPLAQGHDADHFFCEGSVKRNEAKR